MAIPSGEQLAAPYDTVVRDRMESVKRDQVVGRLWSKDHRLWKPDPAEITNRLGWLSLAEEIGRAHV